ncbi:MAG: sterol desaturase family protein [Rhodoferax sp.]|nr:sterol desaturase family protein [Rhodoferax sp.]
MLDGIVGVFADLQAGLFEGLVQPVLFVLGLGHRLPEGFAATGWLLVGVVQLLVLLAVIGPLQRWRPVEPVTDRQTVRVDILYTVIQRLGLIRLLVFFTLEPLLDRAFGGLRLLGWGAWQLDDLWPGVTDRAWVSLLLYLVVLDFLGYWVHRGQHGLNAWWQLHALHHAQRQMTMWSDSRNHLLDDLVRDVLFALAAQCIGVAPGQFVALIALTQLSESLQHANLRLSFGRWGERLWVSPRFHRQHHAIDRGELRAGANYGVLLPWWDHLFGTACHEDRYDPTGVRDQVLQGRDYGRGFLAQQWLGLLRLVGRA